jgi:ABC-type phosphate transport system substrate-binding protein
MWYFNMTYHINNTQWKINKSKTVLQSVMLACSLLILDVKADIVVVVNPSNPIESLSKKDVQRLFLGKMHKFPNSNMKVESVDNSDKSKDYDVFYSSVIDISKSKLKRYRAYYLFSGKGRLPTQIKDTKGIIQYISITKNAIAYMDKSQVTNEVKVIYSN